MKPLLRFLLLAGLIALTVIGAVRNIPVLFWSAGLLFLAVASHSLTNNDL